MEKRRVPVKSESRALQQESARMEERLKELKTMMAKEKAKRERTNGMFWKSGQRGAQLHHNEGPLPPKSSSTLSTKRPARVRVLTESNIKQEIEQSRVEQAALLGEKENPVVEEAGGKSREVGRGKDCHLPPSCGQCDKESASLFCVECQERYCECCYPEFHRRGALARHHAQPLSSDHGSSLREVTLPHSTPTHVAGEGQGRGHAPSGTGGSGSLLEGTFNEDQSTASFREALMAWRTGGSGGEPNQEEEKKLREEKGPPPVLAATATQSDTPPSTRSPAGAADCTTSPSLSYLDKMLIRKHRTDPFLLARQSSATQPRKHSPAQSSRSSDNAPSVVENEAVHQPSQYNLFYSADDWIQCDESERRREDDVTVVRCKSRVEIEELIATVGMSEAAMPAESQSTTGDGLGSRENLKGAAGTTRSSSAALQRAVGSKGGASEKQNKSNKGGASKKQSKSSKTKSSANVVPPQAIAPESGVNHLVLQSVKQAWDDCRRTQSGAELGAFFLVGMSECEEAVARAHSRDNHQLLLGGSSNSSGAALLSSPLWDTSASTRVGREEDAFLPSCDSEDEENVEYLRPESVLTMAYQLDDQTNREEDSTADAETLQSLAWELVSNATEGGRDTALSVRDENQEELDFTDEPLHPLEDSLSTAGDELSALGLFNQQSMSQVLAEMDREAGDDCN